MNNFLKESRKLLLLKENLSIVLGNESCDLDSAISALCLGYFYFCIPGAFPAACTNGVLPVLNIPKKEYPLKTEVRHFLRKNDVDESLLTFRDELEEDALRRSSLVLVDHHVSPFFESVAAVFDHRPFDAENAHLKAECRKRIEPVGSCATLIAELMLQTEKPLDYALPLRLLYGTIVLDTVNFSATSQRFHQFDVDAAEQIEAVLGITNASEHRLSLFEELSEARRDVSALNAYHLLHKDLKKLSNPSKTTFIPIPVVVKSLMDFIALPDAEESVKCFAEEQQAAVVVLIGTKLVEGVLERDVGVISISNEPLAAEIVSQLQAGGEVQLLLEEYEDCRFLGGRFFSQKNLKATRKQVLPIVKAVLDQF